MRRHGYSGRIATGTLAAGGTLGIQLPPSIVLVIYAILTEQNISKLFAAAVVPGLIAMVGYMIAVAIYVRLVPGHSPDVEDAPPPMTWPTLMPRMTLANEAGISSRLRQEKIRSSRVASASLTLSAAVARGSNAASRQRAK